MTTIERAEEPDDPELLLPWLAAGTLKRRDAQRVEAALAREPELRHRYALVCDELSEDIHLNEMLGAPSMRALDKLMAGIEAEPPRAKRRSFDIGRWIATQVAQFSPRALGWSASAAALVIALQAGLLAGLYVGERPVPNPIQEVKDSEPAPMRSLPSLASVPDNTIAIGFAPEVTAAEITRFLESYHAVVVDGPSGGFYKILLTGGRRSKADLADVLQRMQAERKVVRLVVPSQ